MNPILSFDLDGTLVKPGFGDTVWLEGIPEIYAEQQNISLKEAKQFFKHAYDTIGSHRREWYDLTYWIHKYQLPITPAALLDHYESHIELYDDVLPILQRLSQHYTLIISSGAMQEFIQKELIYTGTKHYFTYFFSSTSDTNTVKKDPTFYQMIADTIGCKTSSIIHIGDHIDYDYHSAKKAGCNAYYLQRKTSSETPYHLTSLQEFETIIQTLG